MSATRISSGSGRVIDPSVFDKFGTVLLESIRTDNENRSCLLFQDPSAVVQCLTSEMVAVCIEQIEDAISGGMHAAGFISYEAGAAWDPHRGSSASPASPLLWFGIYDRVESFESPAALPAPEHLYEPIEHRMDVSPSEYTDNVRKILTYIRNGETYQVNYTARTSFQWKHGAWQLYLRLRRSQPVPYGAFINCGRFSLVSLSPELFLKKRGDVISTRPMKGTAPRGNDRRSDEKIAKWLKTDPKNRAENLMIVDLMRNDLGRIAETGTVRVFDPFRIEPYSGLFQMTSGIRCRAKKGMRLGELFEATYPPGSVTGAPKINTMKIISDLETTPRRSYTGAIGAIHPDGDLTMSVAIRTVICGSSGKCEMGVGSGIVSDSDPPDEYREVSLKADFLNFSPSDRVDLFETILLDEDGTLLWLEEHLDRMERSAADLEFVFSRNQARSLVERELSGLSCAKAAARLVLTRTGDMSVEVMPLSILGKDVKRVIISSQRMDSADNLIFHKTTHRKIYDLELAWARRQGFLEVIFTNIDGYLTEGAFTNLFVLTGTGWITPPVQCGLLPGVWRGKYLEATDAAEARVKVSDLFSAERVVIGNSVRGALDVDEVVDDEGKVLFKK